MFKLITEKNFTFYLKEIDLKSNYVNPNSHAWADRLWFLIKKIAFGLSQPVIEVVYGIWKDTIFYWPILTWGVIFDILVLSGLDQMIFNWLRLYWLYPKNPITYTFYAFFGATMGFWIWGAIQARRKVNMIERLTQVFVESGLKSPMGKLPSFIEDRPVDELVRKLKITNAFMPKAKFEEAKERLESSLQVYIDEITESRSSGTIDILYSHYEIARMVEAENISLIGPHKFFIGQTRAKPIYSSLIETPHLLIGGQTGGGKSTFLRQLVTTFYTNNPSYKFSLIDMKGGLEFQIFEGIPRATVYSTFDDAKKLFEELDNMLTERMKILKFNTSKDIEAFNMIPLTERKRPDDVSDESMDIQRHVTVIDEAAELFLASAKSNISDVQALSRRAIRIAAQGRAVGLHLIVATQKPDSKAINSQIKANLTGIISFPMATLGASFSILGNGRAKELPAIPGRAIWKNGLEQFEVQTPFLNPHDTKCLLDKIKKDTPNG